MTTLYQLSFYVPETHLEQVKQALFQAGAGRVGNYDCCAWQTKGQGQFRPLNGSKPYLGQQDKITQVEEYKVELVVTQEYLTPTLQALLKSHPYETPAYNVIPLTPESTLKYKL